MSEIEKELSRIQGELKAPKNQLNKFGNYKYRSCEDILEAVKKIKGDCSVCCSDRIEAMGDRYYVVCTASLRLGGECISVEGWAREAQTKKGMDDSQITGATSSYARKYALNGLFAIDDTKDADATNDHDKKPPAKKATKKIDKKNYVLEKPANDDLIRICEDYIKELELDQETRDKAIKWSSGSRTTNISEIYEHEAQKLKEFLAEKVEEEDKIPM